MQHQEMIEYSNFGIISRIAIFSLTCLVAIISVIS